MPALPQFRLPLRLLGTRVVLRVEALSPAVPTMEAPLERGKARGARACTTCDRSSSSGGSTARPVPVLEKHWSPGKGNESRNERTASRIILTRIDT